MNCWEAEQFFDAYLDNELSGSLRVEFDAHRLRCAVCQQKLAMMEVCEHIIARDSQGPGPAGDLTDRVMREIGERRVIALRVRRRRITIAAAVALQAAAVLVIAVVWSQFSGPAATSAPEARVTAEVDPEVDRAWAAKDKNRMYDLIFASAEEKVKALGLNLKQDADGLKSYATNLSILDDLSSLPDTTALSPWGIIEAIAPAAPEEREPAPSATGSFSL